ncbi:diguanylate cyclase [Clostridium thermarum]|uniref:diguanylate cyclase n=1 Tax=Clostridium thermarum TaxID=1716543 RepID=UPI00112396E8|nr:GGDEF domain-containing protein [Clostridium thermarum]
MQLKKKRLTFGLIVDWISGWGEVDYYQTKIISGVGDYAKEKDINLMCFVVGRLGSPNEWERSRNLLVNFIHKNHVDGVIVLPTAIGIYGQEENVISMLDGFKGIPIVNLNESYGRYHTVSINNYNGMRRVVDHVIEEHKCRRIAFIGGPKSVRESDERHRAFYDSLRDHNITYYPELYYEGSFLFDSGGEAIKYFKENNLQYDGIICANDNMAVGALTELHKQYGKIPEDLPITGFDDADISKFHGLTTVSQSFYEQARASADMLYRLIEGQEVERIKSMDTELIVRSSCGCVGSMTTSAFAQLNLLERDTTDSVFWLTKDSINKELEVINKIAGLPEGSDDYKDLLKYENNVVDAFYEEFINKREGEFLSSWNSLTFWAILKKLEITFLQDVLVCIRKNIIANWVNKDNLIAAENMFQAASIIVCDAVKRMGASSSFLSFVQTDSLECLAEELMSNLDWQKQMDALHKFLPEFNINKGYVSIYEDRNHPLRSSRLILGFNGDYRAEAGKTGIYFNTLDILPEDIMKELRKDRFNVIVMALHQGDNPLGYGVFGFENRVNKIYEVVRYNIGVALNGALLVENIRNQALDLERQVEERTSELSSINMRLTKEIQRRKEVEEQLKKAMEELQEHNIQLRTQSLRDELTGLYNRRGFMTLARKHFEYSQNYHKEFLLLYGDLDGLKQINDRFGHCEGDYAIKKVAEILTKTLKSDDIIARISGDEFTAVLIGASSRDEPIVREKIQKNCALVNASCCKPYRISFSTGIACFNPNKPVTLEELIEKADQDLYAAKDDCRSKNIS